MESKLIDYSFTLETEQDLLDDVNTRVKNSRITKDFGNQKWQYGTEESYLKDLIHYWINDYDWRAQEKKINAFSQVEKSLNDFELKEKYNLRIGVTSVKFEDKAIVAIPENYKKNIKPLENIFAQLFSSRLSLHNDVALVPYIEGMAIGAKMKQQFVNSDVIYDIELPKPDYNIDLTIRGFKKVLAKKSDVNNIYFWATFLNLKISQPDLNKIYMDDDLKNVIKKSIPSQITDINDWYKFYITTYELFDGFSYNINAMDEKWILKTNKTNEFKKSMQNIGKLMVKFK